MFEAPASADRTCVLYAADSGRIVFSHRLTSLGNAMPLSDREFEARARALLADTPDVLRGSTEVEGPFEMLIVPSETLRRPGHVLLVDHATRSLVSQPRGR